MSSIQRHKRLVARHVSAGNHVCRGFVDIYFNVPKKVSTVWIVLSPNMIDHAYKFKIEKTALNPLRIIDRSGRKGRVITTSSQDDTLIAAWAEGCRYLGLEYDEVPI